MREEHVTKAILKWLMDNGWIIVCYDFPQSGTGKSLHPNNNTSEKNKGTIIPDVVAVKGEVCSFFENKDRFRYPDYEKQNDLIVSNDYSDAISNLLHRYAVRYIYYGIGLPTTKHGKSSMDAAHLVDFVVCVNEDMSVQVSYNPNGVQFDL